MLSQRKRFVDIIAAEFGPINTKCYILRNKKHCLIIDPSDQSNMIINFVNANFSPEKVDVFMTKSEKNFGGATADILKKFENSKVFLSKKELSKAKNLSIDKNKIKCVVEGDTLLVDDEKFRVIETDSNISLFGPESNVVFTGDSLILRKGIDEILKLPKNTIVMPAHGEESSIRIESSKKQ